MDAQIPGESQETGGTARRGRRSNRKVRGDSQSGLLIEQKPFKQPKHIYKPLTAVSEDELESIHDASLRVLEDIGIDFINEQAKQILKDAGADVDPNSNRVRMDRDLVLSAISSAPSEFTFHARNPAHNVIIGGDKITFNAVASAPNSVDADNGRRPGNREDFRNFLRLIQYFNIIHVTGGYPVEPVEIHPSVRHLDCLSDMVKFTDKLCHIYSLGKERNLDGIEILRIATGVSEEELVEKPITFSVINTSSPLRIDTPMLQGIIEMSSRGQAIILTPFTLAGAMAPVTVIGALVQQNAEALAGIAFTQLVRKGAPVVYGGFTSNVDMRSGAPAFGTPEYIKAAIIGGQLARRYNLPYRTSGVCAANTVDAQSAYETVFSLWGALNGGGNVIKHAAGWLEGGLSAGFEKFIVDVDNIQMLAEYFTPLTVDEDSFAIEAMRDVGPGGHFFGTEHTQSRYKTAFYSPIISDWRNYETWEEAGKPIAYEKANTVYKQVLAEYQKPALDQAIEEEIDSFVAKRKEEGGVPTDF